MKEIIIIGSLLIVSGCTYLQQHPEVVQEIEKDAELVVEEIATDVIKAELEAH